MSKDRLFEMSQAEKAKAAAQELGITLQEYLLLKISITLDEINDNKCYDGWGND